MTVTLGLRLDLEASEIEGRVALFALGQPGARARLIAHGEGLQAYLAAQLRFLQQMKERDPSGAAAAELEPHLKAATRAEDEVAHILAFLTHLEETPPMQTGKLQ
ncbi:hypothetical protein [Anianabacter salinae]|uniref:hypothetical protein n=1 Tax=Anianabacter salinae TaxID=2851023 RepID=UPI00225E2081|nr:hypothetical protein [Anianabacter salinae]MBV0912849.1 hypothetical protein [Anianabacter salinae]